MTNPLNHKFAYELADALHDRESLEVYIDLTERFAEPHLRKILIKVLSIPEEKIRKTRGALFTFLANQNGKRNHFRD